MPCGLITNLKDKGIVVLRAWSLDVESYQIKLFTSKVSSKSKTILDIVHYYYMQTYLYHKQINVVIVYCGL